MMRNGELDIVPTLGEKFRMEQGNEIGRRAQELYPDGVRTYTPNLPTASKRTIGIMNQKQIPVIFEGTFLIDSYVARADILELIDDQWHMIEVKSSVNDKDEFIDDMAYTTMIINRCGFDVSSVSLFLVSKDYRLGMENKALFKKIDHTPEVLNRVKEFATLWEKIEEITKEANKPESQLKYECKDCEIFEECLGKNIENHIFDIPRLGQAKFEQLKSVGIVKIEDIPDTFSLTKTQSIVHNSVLSGKVYATNKLKDELDSISWPAFYLDFESVMTAIPLFSDIAPYTQIPIQYSIHVCSEPGKPIDHKEYLANHKEDWRKDLANDLIKNLGDKGSILCYSNFEKTILNKIKEFCPDMNKQIDLIIGRLIDLEGIIKRNYYHPQFHGSTSIKTTLPAIVPNFSYKGLNISDGDMASATFAYMVEGKYNDHEIKQKKQNLLDYCKHDTLAMVKIHDKLVSLVT